MLSTQPHGLPHPHMQSEQGPQQRQFNPYTENGGTILAIAGKDFSVIAGDTRQSEGYSIQTRYAPKVFRLYVLLLLSRRRRHSRRWKSQNRSRCARGKWLRRRRQHVREESQAASRGEILRSCKIAYIHLCRSSGTATPTQRTCRSAQSRA